VITWPDSWVAVILLFISFPPVYLTMYIIRDAAINCQAFYIPIRKTR